MPSPPEPSPADRPGGATLLAAAFLAAAVVTVVGLAVVACAEPNPDLKRKPVASAPPTLYAAVSRVCDFFTARTVDQLGTAEAQGNAGLYASLPGVPGNLRTVVTRYYADGITVPDTGQHRAVLDERRTRVLDTCATLGFQPSPSR